MGVLSWLFTKNPAGKSYIRRWLAREIGDDRDKADVFTIFGDLILAASRFAQPADDRSGRPPAEAGQYAGDATIFEIACYTHFRLECWLAANQPGLKAQVADPVAIWISEIFALAWDRSEEYIGQLVNERLAAYRAAGADADGVRRQLAERLLRTKGGRRAESDRSEVSLVAEGDRPFILQSLETYELAHIPAVLEAIREHCRLQSECKGGAGGEEGPQTPAGREERDYLLAMALLAQNDLVRAARAFTKVIDANPEYYAALLERGKLLFALRHPLEAIDDFSRAIAVDPGDWRAYLERGRCYHQALRQGDEAMADYDKAISLAKDSAAAHFARGALFDEIDLAAEKQAGENGEAKAEQTSREFLAAIDDYSRAIALNPEHDEAYVARGMACARKARAGGDGGYAARAVADLEKAMSLDWEHGYLFKTVDELNDLLERTGHARQPATL